jgi:hypothetical protein
MKKLFILLVLVLFVSGTAYAFEQQQPMEAGAIGKVFFQTEGELGIIWVDGPDHYLQKTSIHRAGDMVAVDADLEWYANIVAPNQSITPLITLTWHSQVVGPTVLPEIQYWIFGILDTSLNPDPVPDVYTMPYGNYFGCYDVDQINVEQPMIDFQDGGGGGAYGRADAKFIKPITCQELAGTYEGTVQGKIRVPPAVVPD